MNDINTVLTTALLAQTSLTGVIDDRLWGQGTVPPAGLYTPNDGGAIVFRVRGGGTLYKGGLMFPSIQFKCYGADEPTAWAVYYALYDALADKALPGIKSAYLEQLGQVSEDQDTGWIFVLAFFTAWMAV